MLTRRLTQERSRGSYKLHTVDFYLILLLLLAPPPLPPPPMQLQCGKQKHPARQIEGSISKALGLSKGKGNAATKTQPSRPR